MQSTAPIDAVLSSIARADRLLVTAHARPDGDAVGGVLACWMMLQRMGKNADMALSDRVPYIYRSLPCAGAGSALEPRGGRLRRSHSAGM